MVLTESDPRKEAGAAMAWPQQIACRPLEIPLGSMRDATAIPGLKEARQLKAASHLQSNVASN